VSKELKEVKEEVKNQAPAAPDAPPQTPPAPTPDNEEKCSRFPIAGTSYSLGFRKSDDTVIDLLDSMTDCRCKARAINCPRCPASDECKSAEDRKRADCLRNPYNEVDRPKEECLKFLLQDNSTTVNIETLLCGKVHCATRRTPKLALGAARTLACGCFGQGISGGQPSSSQGSAYANMICEGRCVCRGTQCSCEARETRLDPRNPPRPPRMPIIPWYPGADTMPRGLR
jgi:hypothetical protein